MSVRIHTKVWEKVFGLEFGAELNSMFFNSRDGQWVGAEHHFASLNAV